MTERRLWGKTLGTTVALGIAFPLVALSQETEAAPSPCTQFAQVVLAMLKDQQSVVLKGGTGQTIGSESDGSEVEAFCSAFVQQVQNADGGSTLSEVASPPPASQDAEDFDPPEILHRVEAEYTVEAREERIQGVVILRLQVDEAGRVTDAEVLKGLPLGLNEAAAAAVRQWRFDPATREGEPVAAQRNVVVEFRL